jgi:tetratricopeptide (TPR) repeat protein
MDHALPPPPTAQAALDGPKRLLKQPTLPRLALTLAFVLGLGIAPAAHAVPLVPDADTAVVERLPARLLPRPAPQAGAPAPSPLQAAAAARQLLEQARREGDPRPAGQALALLAPWRDAADAPAPVVVALATVEQYLHDFEGAARRLQALLERDAAQPQAWLTLATLRRVQGRYAESDEACRHLAALRSAPLYARACLAENTGLRGGFEDARKAFETLLAEAGADTATRAWLLTSLGELQARAGQPAEAERAFRAALRAQPDGYTALALADLLLAQGRAAEVPTLLRDEPRSDGVLLRLAMAGAPGGMGVNDAAAELRERMAQAAQRPGVAALDARERALFELAVQRDARAALAAARDNTTRQREPLDLLLLARAARTAGDAGALAQTRTLLAEVGLHDRRIEAALGR